MNELTIVARRHACAALLLVACVRPGTGAKQLRTTESAERAAVLIAIRAVAIDSICELVSCSHITLRPIVRVSRLVSSDNGEWDFEIGTLDPRSIGVTIRGVKVITTGALAGTQLDSLRTIFVGLGVFLPRDSTSHDRRVSVSLHTRDHGESIWTVELKRAMENWEVRSVRLRVP